MIQETIRCVGKAELYCNYYCTEMSLDQCCCTEADCGQNSDNCQYKEEWDEDGNVLGELCECGARCDDDWTICPECRAKQGMKL